MNGEPMERRLIGDLASATLTNAAGLAEDAELLLNGQRWARAFSLAILAIEELGKFHILLAAGTVAHDEVDWPAIRDAFKTHRGKYRVGLAMFIAALPLEHAKPILDKFDYFAREDQKQKLRGFYVGLDDDGSIDVPALEVSEAGATQAVRVANGIVRSDLAVFDGMPLGEVFESAPARYKFPEIGAALAKVDGAQLARVLHSMR